MKNSRFRWCLFLGYLLLIVIGFTACENPQNSPVPPTPTPDSAAVLSLNRSAFSLSVGRENILKAKVTPAICSNMAIQWSSSDTSVVRVDSLGHVYGVRLGTAVVCAIADSLIDSCVVTVKELDIYAVGTEYIANSSAVLWTNGVKSNLTDVNVNSRALGCFVSYGDLYVVGYRSVAGLVFPVATIWHDGMTENLTDGSTTGYAYSVYVDDKDVYVAGYIGSPNQTPMAAYWKNGEVTVLTDGAHYANANSIFVHEGTVYVAGYDNRGKRNIAVLWVDGEPIDLTDGTFDATANSVYVDNNEVYVAYTVETSLEIDNQYCNVWHNYEVTNLTDGTTNSDIRSIYVYNGDVYVGGRYHDKNEHYAAYWKNGMLTKVYNEGIVSNINSLCVVNDTVYSGGNVFESHNYLHYMSTFWVNDSATIYTDGTYESTIESVFVY